MGRYKNITQGHEMLDKIESLMTYTPLTLFFSMINIFALNHIGKPSFHAP